MLGKTNITTLSEGAIVTEVEDFKWIQMQSGVYGNFVKAIYKNDYLAAITADGTIAYTTDGEVWQVSVLEYEDCKLNDIEWDGSRFLLVGSCTVDTEETALLLVTNNFESFTKKEISISDFYEKEYLSIYHVNRKYIVICRSRKSSASTASVGGLYVYMGDLESTWEKQILIKDSYYVDNSISIAHNTDGVLFYFKHFYAIDGTDYLYKVDVDKVYEISAALTKKSLPDIKVFECKDNLLYMSMLSDHNYRFAKVLNTNEEILLSTDVNYRFVDGVYFNNCELFINNHEMLIVKKGESIADKTLDDLIEIAPELTMNCITKAFGQLYIFGNQGAILKSSVETNNEGTITVQTLSAKKALSDAKQYTDEQYAILEARIAALEGVIIE